MPDVREVYHMVTQQKSPEPGALERQQTKQVRSARTKRIGALVLVALIGIAAIALVVILRDIEKTTSPADDSTPTVDRTAAARDAARGFVGAFGAFHARQAMTYAADGADLSQLVDGQLFPDEEGLTTFLRFLKAMGYSQSITSCEAQRSELASDVLVACDISWYAIRSDEIGKGPYPGNISLTVRDGEIVRASLSWNLDTFSTEMWEPFWDWVRENHPEDVKAMYIDDGTNFRLTEGSTHLWRQRTREYVRELSQ